MFKLEVYLPWHPVSPSDYSRLSPRPSYQNTCSDSTASNPSPHSRPEKKRSRSVSKKRGNFFPPRSDGSTEPSPAGTFPMLATVSFPDLRNRISLYFPYRDELSLRYSRCDPKGFECRIQLQHLLLDTNILLIVKPWTRVQRRHLTEQTWRDTSAQSSPSPSSPPRSPRSPIYSGSSAQSSPSPSSPSGIALGLPCDDDISRLLSTPFIMAHYASSEIR